MAAARAQHPLPAPGSDATWHQASEAFLRRDLAPGSRRIYRLTLDRIGSTVGADRRLADLTARRLPRRRPSIVERQVATLRSFAAFAQHQGWIDTDPTTAIERRLSANARS